MRKIVRPEFENHFTETSGFEEYGKHLAGENMNQERQFVTSKEVYLVGNSEVKSGFKGFGGSTFRLWNKDGTIVDAGDIWRLRDRTDEEITTLKMENHYTPFDGINRHHFNTASPEDYIFPCLPWKLKEPINSNQIELLEQKDAITKCEVLSLSTEDKLDSILYTELARTIKDSNKKYCVFNFEGHRADADYELLKLINEGCTHFDRYEAEILKSSWQWSISIHGELLSEMKDIYYQVVTKRLSKSAFFKKVLQYRFMMSV
jgi:hypothetical protein